MFEQLKIDDAVEQATKLAKDGVYLTVGLAAVTAEKTQEQWQEAGRQLEAGLASGKDQVATFTARFEPAVKAVDERFTALEARIGELVERTVDVLPEPAGKAVEAAFAASKTARAQVFQLGCRPPRPSPAAPRPQPEHCPGLNGREDQEVRRAPVIPVPSCVSRPSGPSYARAPNSCRGVHERAHTNRTSGDASRPAREGGDGEGCRSGDFSWGLGRSAAAPMPEPSSEVAGDVGDQVRRRSGEQAHRAVGGQGHRHEVGHQRPDLRLRFDANGRGWSHGYTVT